jgi:two-component system, sensor histidine kinase and response regulator
MKPTILAVDDDPIILDMYEAILSDAYNLYTVSSGEEALDFLNSHPRVDLILLDLMMPGMDGYETCQKIRENPLFSHMKVILVSAKVMLEDRLQGYEIGADDYITKPFQGSELVAKVKVFLRLKNAEEIDRIKTNFITLLNHEARTPLTTMLGYAAFLKESPNLDNQEKRFVDQIIKYGNALSRSSEKTVLLSDLKSGNVRLEKQKIYLNDVFAECQSKFSKEAEEKHLSLQFRNVSDLWIDGDLKLLRFALEALVDNAIKFAREETSVEVTVKTAGDRIQVEIANDGEKIPIENREDIFEELLVQDIEHHHQGHGLSLAITRRIVEAHEGTLSVKDHDNGPAFVIEIKS